MVSVDSWQVLKSKSTWRTFDVSWSCSTNRDTLLNFLRISPPKCWADYFPIFWYFSDCCCCWNLLHVDHTKSLPEVLQAAWMLPCLQCFEWLFIRVYIKKILVVLIDSMLTFIYTTVCLFRRRTHKRHLQPNVQVHMWIYVHQSGLSIPATSCQWLYTAD